MSCATKNASEPYRRQRVAMRESSGLGSSSPSGGGNTGDRLALRSAAIFARARAACCGAGGQSSFVSARAAPTGQLRQ